MRHLTLADLAENAPRFVLANTIRHAIDAGALSIKRCLPFQSLTFFPNHNTSQTILDIPIRRVRDDTQIHYVSAVALKLSALCNLPAPEIADRLIHSLVSMEEPQPNLNAQQNNPFFYKLHRPLSSHLILEKAPSGYLHIYVTEAGLLSWMTTLVLNRQILTKPWVNQVKTKSLSSLIKDLQASPELFNIQHAIARCLSLLHLATAVNSDIKGYSPTTKFTSTLGEHLPTPENERNLAHATKAEHQILQALIDACDEVAVLHLSSVDNPKRYLRIAAELSIHFQAFHAQSRMSTHAWKHNPEQAQFRLDVTQLCAAVLRSLLEEGVGIPACQRF